MSDSDATMTLIEHLEELRRRLIYVVVTVLVAAAAGFFLAGNVINLLKAQLPDQYEHLTFLGPADAFAAYLKVAGFLGIAIGMPMILYQVWAFVTPGLTARERRFIWPVTVAAIALFALGVFIGYLIIPFALNFLLNFSEGVAEPNLTIDAYIGFVTTMLLAFGVVLEFPIVLVGLSRVGILNYRRLASRRRWAVLVIVLFAIIMTPGGDPISPLILSGVMYLLFEISLLIIRGVRR